MDDPLILESTSLNLSYSFFDASWHKQMTYRRFPLLSKRSQFNAVQADCNVIQNIVRRSEIIIQICHRPLCSKNRSMSTTKPLSQIWIFPLLQQGTKLFPCSTLNHSDQLATRSTTRAECCLTSLLSRLFSMPKRILVGVNSVLFNQLILAVLAFFPRAGKWCSWVQSKLALVTTRRVRLRSLGIASFHGAGASGIWLGVWDVCLFAVYLNPLLLTHPHFFLFISSLDTLVEWHKLTLNLFLVVTALAFL